MKIITFAPLFFFLLQLLSIKSQTPAENDTLSNFYTETDEYLNSTDFEINKMLNSADRTCVKDKLKLTSSGSKTFNRKLGFLVASCGFYLCLNNPRGFSDEYINLTMNGYGTRYQDTVDCFAYALHEIDSELKVIKNFSPSTMKHSTEFCNNFIEGLQIDRSIKFIEQDYGKLDKLTCGAVSEKEIKKFFFTAIVLKFASYDVEVLKAGKDELEEQTLKKFTDSCKCIVDRLGEGFLGNL